jgi:transmembrane sensor
MQDENRRKALEAYLQGHSDDPEAAQRFDAWYNAMQPDASLDLNKEEVAEAMQRIATRLQAATKPKRSYWKWAAAAAAAVLVVISLAMFDRYGKTTTVATRIGEAKNITLADGTVVHLNESSAISYTGHNVRAIKLEGEAFFEVATDAKHPFTVHAGKARIKVLGTSFNVAQHPSDVIVAVRDGLISLQSNDGESLLLSAGKAGMLDNNTGHALVYDHPNVNNYLSWMDGQLVFDGVALKDVAAELENIYSVRIQIQDESLENIHLTLQYKHAPLKVILGIICSSLDLQYKEQNGTIMLQRLP